MEVATVPHLVGVAGMAGALCRGEGTSSVDRAADQGDRGHTFWDVWVRCEGVVARASGSPRSRPPKSRKDAPLSVSLPAPLPLPSRNLSVPHVSGDH